MRRRNPMKKRGSDKEIQRVFYLRYPTRRAADSKNLDFIIKQALTQEKMDKVRHTTIFFA